MPKFQVTRSVVINAPVDEIYNKVNDFNHWRPWSPWLIQEPEAVVKVADDNKFQEWEGKRIGTGNIRIVAEEENKSIDYELKFLKPWKSQAKSRFSFSSTESGTEVTWTMDGSLPFLMFWMKKMMMAFVGFDYEKGLNMLKDYIQDGEVHSKLDFKGASSFEGCNYVGTRTACAISKMPDKMKADMGKLHDYGQSNPDNITGPPFTIYHKWDMVKGRVDYTAGIPVKSSDGAGNGLFGGSIPATPVYSIAHIGPYHHLGNVWGTMYNMHRSKTFKMNKKIDPFEIYKNNPMDTDPNDLVTEIYFATK